MALRDRDAGTSTHPRSLSVAALRCWLHTIDVSASGTGCAQAEGVANLDKVPETGALVIVGYPKFGGGLGGYARYIAVCPPDWPYGATIGPQDAPLPKSEKPLHYDAAVGMRIR